LYSFKGKVQIQHEKIENDAYDIELKQFLHSGTIIRNSGSILALVLYCGKMTKIMLN
jgi:hypothetical protein